MAAYERLVHILLFKVAASLSLSSSGSPRTLRNAWCTLSVKHDPTLAREGGVWLILCAACRGFDPSQYKIKQFIGQFGPVTKCKRAESLIAIGYRVHWLGSNRADYYSRQLSVELSVEQVAVHV